MNKKNKVFLIERKNLDAREEQLEEVERQKEAELERIGALSQAEARDIILAQTEENLTKEIASRIREAEQEVKERSDKMAKDILVQAMQRIAGEYVAESTKLNSSPTRRYYEGTHYWS